MPIKNVGADIKIFQGGDGVAMRRNLVVFDARKLWTFLEWGGGLRHTRYAHRVKGVHGKSSEAP